MFDPLIADSTLNQWIIDRIGGWSGEYTFYPGGLQISQGIGLLAMLGIGILLGYLIQKAMFYFIRPSEEDPNDDWQNVMLDRLPRPMRYAVALIVVRIGEAFLGLTDNETEVVALIVEILLIAVLTWMALRSLTVGTAFLESYLTSKESDPLERRAIHTQVVVPSGILRVVLIVVGTALILFQFPVMRSIGGALLASAGAAGIVIGFAAQRTVANLFAGLQLAIFQPIKIGDVVVAEGEWGTIEQINLTYVTMKIWDQRRLILPVTYFLEKPFTNWTKNTHELLGTIYIYTDYTVPIEEVRKELKKIVKDADQWDGRTEGVLVTALQPDTVEVRALISAKNASDQWDLRCHVREKLLEWMQRRGKDHMPKFRVEMKEQKAT